MEHLVQILSVLGLGTIGAALIAAVATRKRVGAETNEKVVATTGELLDLANADVERTRTERDRERRDRIKAERRERAWWERADAHAQWDRDRLRAAVERGDTIPPPPPLFPPDSE